MGLVTWLLLGIGVAAAFLIAQWVYLAVVLAWEQERTRGLAYYGLPPFERHRFKARLRRHALLLYPILRLLGRSKANFRRMSFRYEGVAGPSGSASAESFARAHHYAPRPDDIFVVTQMKCGTTWMQHVVYEVLHRGGGTLVETGTALYAVSPWLEGLRSVSLDQAPLLGTERPSRLIKTHLPVSLCPFSPEGRYIYVARHPVSCFASCIDFVATNVGSMLPPLPAIEEWFRSPELMWWGTWTDHVKGWWARAQAAPNVLFVHFEDMKKDLPAVIRQVSAFLGMAPLSEVEVGAVAAKCSFRYMQEHQEAFEMHPPHLLQTNAELFVRGTADRHQDVPAEVRDRLRSWCREELAGSGFPLDRVYPDVGGVGGSAT